MLVPSAARMFAQVVHSPEIFSCFSPYCRVAEGLGGLALPPQIAACPGSINLRDLQLSQQKPGSFEAVSEPLTVFRWVRSWNSIRPFEMLKSCTKLKVNKPCY